MNKYSILTLIILFSQIGLIAQQVQTKEVYTYANSTLIEDIMTAKDIEFEALQYNQYKIKLGRYNVSVSVDEGDLLLRAYFSGEPTLNRINDFNTQYRWARVYLDKDGDLTIASELSFTGGITKDGIHTFINTFKALLETLSEFMD